MPIPGPPGPPGPPGAPGNPGVSLMGQKGEPGMDARGSYFGESTFFGRQGKYLNIYIYFIIFICIFYQKKKKNL